MSTPHLLDHLAALVRQTCLSELRRTPEVRLALLCTPASAFPAPMWREALYYLAGEALPDGSAAACREQLLAYYVRMADAERSARLPRKRCSSSLDSTPEW